MDKLSNVDWGGMLKSVTNKVKQYTLNLSDLELKVEDATSNETWGPHGSVMSEIADASYDFDSYRQIMGVIARRLQEKDENWRMCYKALLLLEFLVKHGPMKVVHDISGSVAVLDRLTYFEYRDANGKDFGVNVRHRAKELLQLVNNPDRVREERNKAKANKAKYTGVSAAEMRSGGYGGDSSGFGGGGASFRSGGASSQRTFGGGGSNDGFGRSGGAGGGGMLGGGGASFGRGGRVSQEDAEEDFHYISKRTTTSEGGEADPLSATRARIDALKLSGRTEGEEKQAGEGEPRKKLLTDVKVNPKIAASLGLKLPAPAPTAPAAAAPRPAAASDQMSLLGGLTEPAPAAAPAPTPATDLFDALTAPAAAAAAHAALPATTAGGWDAFSPSAAVPAPAPAAAAGSGWDAFGTSAAPAPTAHAAAPVDLFGGLEAPAVAPALPAARPAFDPFATAASPAAAAAPAFDLFASLAGPPAAAAPPPAASLGDLFAAAPASSAVPVSPSAGISPTAASLRPASATGVGPGPRPLPEDMFAGLSGISKEVKPMGSGRGLHMEPPPLSSTQGVPAAAAAPGGLPGFPVGPPGGMASPMGPVVMDPRTGQPVMLVPVPLAPGQPGLPVQQQGMGLHGQPGMPGIQGMGQPDLSSLLGPPSSSAIAKPAPPQAKDPFADLLG